MRNVMITGASRGLGLELYYAFLNSGDRVGVISRSGMNVAVKDPLRSFEYQGDCSNEKDVHVFYDRFDTKFGLPDLVIHNAADFLFKRLEETALEEWKHIFTSNVESIFLSSKELIKRAKLQKPKPRRIINIGSLAGISNLEKFEGTSAYSASKFAVHGLTEVFAKEAKAVEIEVIAIAPGAMKTSMLSKTSLNPNVGANPKDVANWIVNLSLSQTGMMSGNVIPLFTNEGPS